MLFVSKFSPLASLEAARPVFLILMGIAMVLISWRLTKRLSGFPAWSLVSGALLLGLGYSVLLPLYEIGVLIGPDVLPFAPDADPTLMMTCHLLKSVSMNGGWLLFGLGMFLTSRAPLPERRPVHLTIVRS